MARPRTTARTFLIAAAVVAAGGCDDRTPGHAGGFVGGDAAVFEPPPAVDAGDAGAPELGDAGEPDGGAAAWTGTWTFLSGSEGLACDGELSVVAASGSLDITPSGAGLRVEEDGCVFQFTLAGDVATSVAGQFCAAWAVPTIPTWTLTMQADGTLLETLGGRVYVGDGVCTVSGTSTLARQ